MKKLCLALSLVLVALAAATSAVRAVTDEPLVTDRPDITESSRVVGSWRWQIETSAQRSQFKLDPVDTETWSIPTLFRFGLGSKLELRVASDIYSTTNFQVAGVDALRMSGFAPIELGLKWHIWAGAERTIAPSLGFLVHVKLPSGSTVFKLRNSESSAVLAADWDLTDRISLGVNAGVDEFEEDNGKVRFSELLTGALGYGITDATSAFIELASSGIGLSSVERILLLDGGLTYLVSPDMQLDTAIGFGLTRESDPDLFFTIGFSYRSSRMR